MNAIFAFLACAALANAGGIPQYSISDIQPDRSIVINRGLSSGLLSKGVGLGWGSPVGLSSLGLSSRSIGLAEPTILSSPLLSKGLSWGGSSLSLAEPTILSSGYSQLSSPLLNKGLSWGAPLGLSSLSYAPIAEPQRTIITRSQPIITRVAAPLITKTLSAPIGWAAPEQTIVRSSPILSKSLSWAPSQITLAEPTVLAEPLSKTIITQSQPIYTTRLVQSAPLISKSLSWGPAPVTLAEPTLLSTGSLLGLGGKGWK